MKKFNTLFTAIAILFSSFAQAQQEGKITGAIKSLDNKGIDAATVSLLKAKDSSLAKIDVSDKSGAYEFENIHEGKYLIKIEAIGYKTSFSNAVELIAENTTAKIDDIKLIAADQSLNELTVTTHRPLIENKIDKTVVNVDASPTNTGLSAMEVLEKSPGVTVDNDGNIKLKGKQGVKIFIDGKPSYLGGQDLTNYLKNLSANQLDQIEIMTQPSAKYDASGNSGVINFKTLKNKNNGFNGTITTSAIIAKFFKNTNGISFNWRLGKLNIFGNYGYSYWEGFNDLFITRRFRADENTPFNSYSDQHTYGRYSGRPQNFKAGVDFYASKKTTLGFVVSGNEQNDKFKSGTTAFISDSLHNLSQTNIAYSQTKNPWTNVGFNVNLQHKLDDKGKEISADADYIFYSTKGTQYSQLFIQS